jgi:hypothetical protein
MSTINSINNNTHFLTSDTGITVTEGDITTALGNVVISNGQLSLQGSVGTDGQVAISNTATGKPVWANITACPGIDITNGAGTISIASTAPFRWIAVDTDTTITVNTGYINIKPNTLLNLTLPVTAAVGTTFCVQGSAAGTGRWFVSQNAGQNIQLGNQSTTPGVVGLLGSTDMNDAVCCVCTVADTTWNVYSYVGSIVVL